MKKQLVIANLGTGNLHSVQKAIEFVSDDIDVIVSSEAERIRSADALVLPGQGAFGTWMQHLTTNTDTLEAIKQRFVDGPVLGICIGMQALFDRSEESGGHEGLGLFAGSVKHFASNPAHQQQDTHHALKIPHMGWNQVRQHSHPLWQGIDDNSRFYFVHSYYADCTDTDTIAGEATYGNDFTCAVARDNVFACQFHPEKSQKAGLTLLKNFVNWNGSV